MHIPSNEARGTLDRFPGQDPHDSSRIYPQKARAAKNPHGVANSDTPRLPTLKELIGYQTYDYTTTPSSVFLNLLPAIDTNEPDVGSLNRNENERSKITADELRKKDLRKVFYDSIENPLELDQLFENDDTESNDIDEESINKRRKTRIDHAGSSTTTIKPTTMRGIPIANLTARSVTRGFYVTKGDIDTTVEPYTTPDYLTSTTDSSVENLTTIPALNTSDESESTVNEVLSKPVTPALEDTDKLYSEYSIIVTKPAGTTPLPTTVKITQSVKDDAASSIANDLPVKPTRGSRGRVRYSDGTTQAYGRRIRGRVRTTTEPNNSKVDVSSTLRHVTVPKDESTTNSYNELRRDTNLIADTLVSSSINIERKTTPLDYTSQTKFETTMPETSTLMMTKADTAQSERFTTVQSTQQIEYRTNEIVSDRVDEYPTTITDYNTKYVNPTTIVSDGVDQHPSTITDYNTKYVNPTTIAFDRVDEHPSTITDYNTKYVNPTTILSDRVDEHPSTITDYNTKYVNPTTIQELTTPSFETTFETENIEKTTVETMTMTEKDVTGDITTENKDISNEITTKAAELVSTVDIKPSPSIQPATTFSTSTQIPSTSLPNLSSSERPVISEEVKEETVPLQRQRSNYQFGQRTRGNGYRRVVQRKELEDRTLSQEEVSNPRPNGRHRVRVYRKRQRRPNVVSSSTEVNNSVSIDDRKAADVVEKRTRRKQLVLKRLKVNHNEYDQETIPTEQNTLQDTTPPMLVEEEYTERPVNEGTLSKNSGSSSNRPKTGSSILINRLRKVNGSSQSSSLVTRPSTVLGDNRKSRPSETTTVPPTAAIADAFEDATVTSPERSVKDEDERAEISDQNGRAQELAVTLADPPSSQTSSNTGRLPLRDTLRRRISTTVAPRTDSPRTSSTNSLRFSTVSRNRQRPTGTATRRTEETTRSSTSRPRRPAIIDYDYYEDEETPIVEKAMYNNGKLFLTNKGTIKCLDQGNFPHPYSCKKFITCARITSGLVVGAEYTCPDKLSFDPVGGICNWSAGLGCKE